MNLKKANKLASKLVISSAFAAGAMLVAPSIGEAALGDRTLSEGMRHNDVKELQDVLKGKGYFTYHTSTGYFGSITKDAVIRFQRANNLPATGVVDKNTVNTLKSQSTKTSTATSASGQLNVNQLLRNGSRGAQVTLLQNKLKAAGYHTSAVDGIYGPQTAQSVRRFQQAKGLLVDGIAGRQTLTALNLFSDGKPAPAPAPSKPAPAPTPPKQETKPAAPSQPSQPTSTLLRLESRGQAVTQLQNDLKRLGFFAANATGYYGTITDKAVRDFQRQYSLAVDGIAGPATLGKIAEVLSGKDNSAENDASFNVMNVIADASELLGVRYVWGGNSPQQGFDCSGFIVYVYNKSNVQLPRTVAQMWNSLQSVSQPQVGDLVFYDTTGGPSHAGIYIGNNKFIQAGTSTGVVISDMNSPYWSSRYLGAKRPY